MMRLPHRVAIAMMFCGLLGIHSPDGAALGDLLQDAGRGSDWPHFLGPNYDGSSPEKGLMREWPKEGPQVLWRTKIKRGWSCPSISGNDVFVSMTDFQG